MPLLVYVFSPDCGGFGWCTQASSPTCLPSGSVMMDKALAGWSFTGKCEGDTWTQDKRDFVNMLVFGEILTANCSEERRWREKGQTERKGEGGEIKMEKQTEITAWIGWVCVTNKPEGPRSLIKYSNYI